jgi:hypothetical protein
MTDQELLEPEGPGISLDALLRDVLPEIKLSLGTLIDRENARALPGRYARLLPESILVVTLRPDAAAELAPMAAAVERELTDSCIRHGSLYDRSYSVQLRRAGTQDSPLFEVAAFAGYEAPDQARSSMAPPSEAASPDQVGSAPPAPLPAADPDATRAEGWQPAHWDGSRWMLIVEGEEGEEREAFRLADPFTTLGRRSDDPRLRVNLALSEAPHVSRRQLALLWDGEEPEPGFRVFNLGLNSLHVEGREIPGAKLGRGPVNLHEIDPTHTARVVVGSSVRIGERGPQLRIVEVPAAADDPDATVYE